MLRTVVGCDPRLRLGVEEEALCAVLVWEVVLKNREFEIQAELHRGQFRGAAGRDFGLRLVVEEVAVVAVHYLLSVEWYGWPVGWRGVAGGRAMAYAVRKPARTNAR